jgi:DNA-binding protein H-NS
MWVKADASFHPEPHGRTAAFARHVADRPRKAQPDHLHNKLAGNIPFDRRKLNMQDSVMTMKKTNLEAMPVDDLWSLHEEISRILSARITSEKRELEKRLAILSGRDAIERADSPRSYNVDGRARRKYPRVFPKYRNPQTPSETWSGRGKQPRWLVAAIESGRKIDDFKIREAGGSKGRRQRA